MSFLPLIINIVQRARYAGVKISPSFVVIVGMDDNKRGGVEIAGVSCISLLISLSLQAGSDEERIAIQLLMKIV
jgi:hypothetical protein